MGAQSYCLFGLFLIVRLMSDTVSTIVISVNRFKAFLLIFTLDVLISCGADSKFDFYFLFFDNV